MENLSRRSFLALGTLARQRRPRPVLPAAAPQTKAPIDRFGHYRQPLVGAHQQLGHRGEPR